MWNHNINYFIKSACVCDVSVWDHDLVALEQKRLITKVLELVVGCKQVRAPTQTRKVGVTIVFYVASYWCDAVHLQAELLDAETVRIESNDVAVHCIGQRVVPYA